ncbi:MAG: hypothetical protein JWO06_1822 [Bacteroidota bacterium]|nr:hypothetical protein [Bacteroidota bacterium]
MTTREKYKVSIRQATKLALPIIGGQLGLVLMGFFDTVQVGGLGPAYMAASGVSSGTYFLFMLLGMGILFAVSPLVSEAFGEGHAWKSIGVFRSALKIALVLCVVFYGVVYVVTDHFEIFRESEKITTLSKRFLHILNYSTPMLMLFTLGKQFMDGTGRTKVSMVVTVIGLLCNVILNWILIYGKLGCPAMGIEGAAIATATARTLMCVILFGYIFYDKQVKGLIAEYKLKAGEGKSYIKPILEIGVPSGLQMFFEVAAFNAAQIMSGWIDETNLAAYQIAISLASITFMMVSGVANAGTIMTGYAFGAKDKEGIGIAGNTVYFLTFCSQFLFAIVFLALCNQLPKMYTGDEKVITLASTLLIWAALFQLSDGFQVVGAGLLRGLQDTRVPSVIAFASYWIIMVPLCYVLTFTVGLGVVGVYIGFTIGLSIAAGLMYLRFRYRLKHVQFADL